jgi:hypothetical protein
MIYSFLSRGDMRVIRNNIRRTPYAALPRVLRVSYVSIEAALLYSTQARGVEHCDHGHPIANLALSDHIKHGGEGHGRNLQKFGLVRRQCGRRQIVADIQMRRLIADALGGVVGADPLRPAE